MATTKLNQCRCCLVTLEDNVRSNAGISLDMCYINFKDYINVFLSKDPRLPQIICPSCISFVNEVKSFRKMVIESEKYLFQVANSGPDIKVDVKQELPDTEDNDTYQDMMNFCANRAMKEDRSSGESGDERTQGDDNDDDGDDDEDDVDNDNEDDEDVKLEDKEDVPLISLKKLKYEKTIIIRRSNVKKKPPGRPKKEKSDGSDEVKFMHIKGMHLEEGVDFKRVGTQFHCCKCDKMLKSIFGYKYHMKMAHIKVPKHTCQICSKNFMTLAPYIKHRLEEHNIDERLKCNACDHVFNTRVQLRRHKNSFHMLGQKIKCESCDYESFSAENLYKHKFKHRTEKEYHCSYCRKSFVRKTTLQLHERIHTGDRRKVCNVCGQAFVQKASLNYHMTKYHPEVNF